MTIELSNHEVLSDPELLVEVRRLAGQERKATARLIAALGELDARRLYLGEGCSSLFTYCTQILHLSEHAAYGRIEAARAARKWPAILDLLADGAVHLTAIGLLAPHLTTENHQRVLGSARHKTKREVEEIVASLRPQPPVASSVRKAPAPKATAVDHSAAPSLAPAVPERTTPELARVQSASEPPRPRAEVKPLAPEHYKVQFTVSRETYQKLREAQDLLRHRLPDGDLAGIFDRALTLLLEELRKAKHAAGRRPRTTTGCASHGRHIPASVKRGVWARDGGQCAFVGAAGRCTERGFLEWHHVVPFAEGGETSAGNVQLRCRAHNAYEAERWFGVKEEDLVRERGEAWAFPCTAGPLSAEPASGQIDSKSDASYSRLLIHAGGRGVGTGGRPAVISQ